MKVTQKQMDALLAAPPAQRYEFFVHKVVDWEEAWGLYDDGWAMLVDDDGTKYFPLWPAKEYAEVCAKDDWARYEPEAIPLADLLNELLPQLHGDSVSIAVFVTPGGKGVTVTAEHLRDELAVQSEERYGDETIDK